MICCHITRRTFLSGAAATFAGAIVPRVSSAAGARDPRFLVVVLRGALDGLSLAAPLGDPHYAEVRGDLALSRTGPHAGLPLDGFFALNPRMPALAKLFGRGEALLVHAAATPYRERSHFDGQDVLESGLARPGHRSSGWLNRAIAALPGGRSGDRPLGFAAGAQVPLIMRGDAPVISWMPPGFRSASSDTKARLLDLYRHTDPGLASALELGLGLEEMTGGEEGEGMDGGRGDGSGNPRTRLARAAAAAAGTLLVAPDAARIAVLDLNGFDTHVNQKPVEGALGDRLAMVDSVVASLAGTLAPVWADSVVAFVTEFGRTAFVNGSAGTDHGTATAALFVGGAVKGGRVLADWPGLAPANLYEGRDLQPTMDLQAVLKGVLLEHLDMPRSVLDGVVFPESARANPVLGLVR